MRLPRALPLAACLALASAPSAGQRELRVGAPLPDLRLPTIDRAGTLDLRELRGRRFVLLEFASW
jgi:hypothetical protein